MLAESYVLRIYRREELAGVSVVGVIEAMPAGWQKPFRSLQDLIDILAKPDPRSDMPKRVADDRREDS